MEQIDERLTAQVVSREPVALSGASSNAVEHVTLRDGRRLVCKRVVPAEDWLSRATGDDGRAPWMWQNGLFDRVPAPIDHTIVSVETDEDGNGWSVFMKDASTSLIHPKRRLGRDEIRRVLAAVIEMHRAFRGERYPQLCTLADRYNLLSPHTGRREAGTVVGDAIAGSWQVFADLTPSEVSAAIVGLAEDPTPLTKQLDACEQTLIHGDVRLANLGLDDERVVLVDWGERTGTAPGPVELASFLVFDADRFDATRDEVIDDFRALAGADYDERAMQLALIGGLVQLGPNVVLDVALGGGDEALAKAKEALAWWSTKVAHAFETVWAPD